LLVSTAADTHAWTEVLDPGGEALIEAARARTREPVLARDRVASLVVGGAYLAVATGLAVFAQSTRSPSIAVYVLLVAGYALASRVEFEIGSGAAIPTELALVPMLFLLPLNVVPLCVTAALLVREPRAFLRGRDQLERLPLLLVSSWHAVGPVLVLMLANGAGHRELRWSDWPVYLLALGAQFAFDFASTSARDWLGVGISPWGRIGFMGWVWGVDAALAPAALAIAFAGQQHFALALLAAPLVGLLAFFARERQVRIDHALELSQAYRGTAFLLGDVVEADDAYTGTHSRHVVDLVLGVSDELGLSTSDRRDAEFVALLHDVGKIRIPSSIINKAGPLDADERAVIETHTIEGEQMLERVGGMLGHVGRLVRSCHEHWDGNGYPDKLAGEKIPLVARIVCACDAFSAMTTDRPYRKARTPQEALAELQRCSGTQFDPQVVDALLRVNAGG
jgi:HD-GYP domain-containing protein (c-di-GMP phosphodiesterase class II)